jgi:YwiC-like protein
MTAAARQKSLVIPREHGAWGILLVPLVTGAGAGLLAGGSAASLLPLAVAALALFWLRTPVESWMGTTPIRARAHSEIRLVRNATFALAAISIGALLWLFWGERNPALLTIGAGAAAAFLAQVAVKRTWRSARTAAQMIGAAGLTSTAPAAYCAITGGWSSAALALWAANFFFAVNQIHFVQLRLHAARAASRTEKLSLGRGFLAGQCLLIALLAAACSLHVFPSYGAVAFLPVLFRGFAWFAAEPQPLAIYALGKSELAYACLFGLLLVLAIAIW